MGLHFKGNFMKFDFKEYKKSIDNKVAYNGFLYKYMEEKLVC